MSGDSPYIRIKILFFFKSILVKNEILIERRSFRYWNPVDNIRSEKTDFSVIKYEKNVSTRIFSY